MKKQELIKFRQAIKDKKNEISDDREKARVFLDSVGIKLKTIQEDKKAIRAYIKGELTLKDLNDRGITLTKPLWIQ